MQIDRQRFKLDLREMVYRDQLILLHHRRRVAVVTQCFALV
jgi:hypothetical protein